MIRKCQLLNKLVEIKRDCSTCPDKSNCKNPDGPDGKRNRPHFQVVIKHG